MSRAQIITAIKEEMRRQLDADAWGSAFFSADDGDDDVIIDGHFNLEKLADAIMAVTGGAK